MAGKDWKINILYQLVYILILYIDRELGVKFSEESIINYFFKI